MNPTIISKLKAMLNRNGRTEAEADTFQIMAAALADKHGIDIAALDAAEARQASVIMHKQVGEWGKCPPEADYAAVICKSFFEVDTITSCGWTERMQFVGTAHHLEVAEYVFNFLLREFRWQWNHRRGRCRNRKQFLYGCMVALHTKLSARFAKPATEAVEVSWKAKRQAYIAATFSKLTTTPLAPKQVGGAATQRGFRAGSEIEIRPGVNGGQRKAEQPALAGFERRLLA
ncbi:MAG: hypothetical protein FD161_3023 [Limisphaerales bacterium]|nr:MAG: hypothetical protein FD161_3023 [Limisphaerales bacterium]KAG0508136.1 MAG: hypothetical protein E1N63_2730 [Limisphaerales bacterium]TXT53011.1 MAG: hypothetical protein FD140_119 [Limisphaerales bacterium]